MLRFLRFAPIMFAMVVTSIVWAGCPEGQKENDRTGECTPIPGWTGASQSLSTASTSDDGPQSLAAGQTGNISFQSIPLLTLNQFLSGKRPPGAQVIPGNLTLARDGADRMPVVILLHGGGGLYEGNTIYDWASKLRSIGIATFVVNSNVRQGCPKCYSQNEGLPNMIDAFQAMALLSTHPRIDQDRIGLMGFSVGGIATLYATVKRFQRMWAPEGMELAAYVSFYPACNYTFNEEEQVTDRPVRILMGDKDQLGWSVPCEDYVNRLRKAGKDFEITIIPGVHHSFDRPETSRKPYSTGPHPTYCLWQEEKDIGLIQVTEVSEAFYAGCLSILPERPRECRQSSVSPEMKEELVTMLELYETDKKTKAQIETDDSGSEQSVDASQPDPALDKEFAEFVARYVSKHWQGWGPGKKIGECLGENSASMTTGAKKGVIKYGIEEAFEKLSDEDVASFDKLFGLCEKGGVKKKILVQSDPALDNAFGEFVMAYISEQWGDWAPGKKIGQCLTQNAVSITSKAKKSVIQYGLEEAFDKLKEQHLESLSNIYAVCEQDSGGAGVGDKTEFEMMLDGFENALVESAKYYEGEEKLMGDTSCEVKSAKLLYDRKAHQQSIQEVKVLFKSAFNL